MSISPRRIVAAVALVCVCLAGGAGAGNLGRRRAARSLVAASGVGGGPSLGFPVAVVADPSGVTYVLDHAAARTAFRGKWSILRIEPDGTRTLVGDTDHGSGPDIVGSDLFMRADGQLTDGLRRLDPATGVRTELPPLDPPVSSLANAVRFLEPEGTLLLANTDGIIRKQPDAGTWTLVSGCTGAECRGAGPELLHVEAVGRADDGTVFVGQYRELLGVDPSTGDREILSGPVRGAGPDLGLATAVLADGADHVLWANDTGVLRVHLGTGNRTVVSDGSTGSGPALRTVEDMVWEAAGTVLLADRSLGAIVRLDPATGARTIVSGGPIGAGPRPPCVSGGAREASGTLVIADCEDGLMRIDLQTGDRTVVSDAVTGSGPAFTAASDVAIVSGELLVADVTSVKAVDPVTGDRRVVSDGGRKPFHDVRFIAAGPAGTVFVGDRGILKTFQVGPPLDLFFNTYRQAAVHRVHVGSGRATLVSGGGSFSQKRGAGAGFYLLPLHALGAAGPGSLAAFRGNELVRVDVASGDRTLVSNDDRGSGPTFGASLTADIAAESSGHWLVVGGRSTTLLRVDPATGDRTVVSGLERGSGPLFERPRVVLVDPSGMLTVVNGGDSTYAHPFTSVVAVDPATGDRTVLSRY